MFKKRERDDDDDDESDWSLMFSLEMKLYKGGQIKRESGASRGSVKKKMKKKFFFSDHYNTTSHPPLFIQKNFQF